MTTNMYSRVEGMLYGYYKKKKTLNILNIRLSTVEKRIKKLTRDIKNCNIELNDTLKAIDYSKDVIQSGSITNTIERELEKAVDNMLRELEVAIREKYKIKSKIINLEKQIENTEILSIDLTDEELQIIELRYGDKLSDREIGIMLIISRTTAQRKRQEVIYEMINKIKK